MSTKENLERIFLQERSALIGLIARKLGDRTLAEDIAQDAFIRFLNSASSEKLRDPKAYLFRIALNLVVDHLRSQTRRRQVEFDDESASASSEIHMRQATEPGADRVLESKERMQILTQAIASMPEKPRHAFTQHRFGGLSYAEIAEEMGVSKSMVEKYIASALAYCRLELTKKGY